MQIPLVSYDIWDTVLRRQCHPDAIKIQTANQLILFHGDSIPFHLRDATILLKFRQLAERDIGKACKEAGLDDEYSIHDVLSLWVMRVLKCDESVASDIGCRLFEDELAHEKRCIYLDTTILETFKNDGALRRIYISDFYMPKASIDQLLNSVGVLEKFDGGYVSCDSGLNKRSGRLFDKVRHAEDCSPNDWHHYGDNAHSDVSMPNSRGINGMLYLPAQQHRIRQDIEKLFESREETLDQIFSAAVSVDSSSTLTDGLVLLTGYTLFIQEQIYSRGIRQVFFFTREGEFFLELYEALRLHSPYRDSLPAGELMEVSRLSTFGPSLRDFSQTELMRIWSLYSTQSLAALFKTLNFDSHTFGLLAKRFEIDINEAIRYPWLDDRVIRFLADTKVQLEANRVLEKQRREAQNYLDKKFKHANDRETIAVVDIGWRGTIQDNIASMYPNIQFHGIYLGLNKFLNSQPGNVSKSAFGPDLNLSSDHGDLIRFVAPLEMLTNSGNGSVLGYRGLVNEGVAVREIDADENIAFDNFSRPMQLKIIESIKNVRLDLAFQSFDSIQLKAKCMRAWRNLIESPDTDLLQAYFSLQHNETFGVGGYVQKADIISTSGLVLKMLTKRGRAEARSRLSAIGWIDGYLAWRNDPTLTKLVRLLYPR